MRAFYLQLTVHQQVIVNNIVFLYGKTEQFRLTINCFMKPQEILSASFLDILFEGRNKAYGAYELRRSYARRTAIALGSTIALSAAILFSVHLAARSKPAIRLLYEQGTVELQQVQEEKQQEEVIEKAKVEPLEKSASTPAPAANLNVEKYVDRVRIAAEVPPEDAIKSVDELKEAVISAFNNKGDVTGIDVVTPPVNAGTGGKAGGGGLPGAGQGESAEDYNKEFIIVQQEARFPGGAAEWKKFLERNLDNNEPANQGAPPNRYTVVVSFIVDKEGNVSDIRAESDPGYGIAAEAIRVIRKSKKWLPAMQNNHNVIFRQRQSITFLVND